MLRGFTRRFPSIDVLSEEELEAISNEARPSYRKKDLISDEEWAEYMKTLKAAG